MSGRNVDVLVCFNLNDYKFKTYILLSTYINPMVTTNQKHMIDTQKLKNKEHKHTTKENYQATREETKKKEEEMSRQLLNQPGNILQKNSN